MNLGIVGAGLEKWSVKGERLARQAIRDLLQKHSPEVLIVGQSPGEAIGVWAEEAAKLAGRPVMVLEPATLDGNGYAARQALIAKGSDIVSCIVPQKLPDGSLDNCKHCGPNNPPHVASAGCYAAWRAKRREWVVLINE